MATIVHNVITQSAGVYRAAPCANYWHSQNRFEGGNFPANWVDEGLYGTSLPWQIVGNATSFSSPFIPSEGSGALSLPDVTSGYQLNSDVNNVFKIGAADNFDLAFMIYPEAYNEKASFILSAGVDFGLSGNDTQIALALSGDGGPSPSGPTLGERGKIHLLRHVANGNAAGQPHIQINPSGNDILVSSWSINTSLPLSEYSSVRIVRENGFMFFYVNDVLVNPTSVYFPNALDFTSAINGSPTTIGYAAGTDYNPGFVGYIDNFRLRNERL